MYCISWYYWSDHGWTGYQYCGAPSVWHRQTIIKLEILGAVIPLWHPQFFHSKYDIRALHEPYGLLGGKDDATLIASRFIVQKFSPELREELSQLSPGNTAVSMLDYLIFRDNKTPQQAVDIINNHF